MVGFLGPICPHLTLAFPAFWPSVDVVLSHACNHLPGFLRESLLFHITVQAVMWLAHGR